MRRTRERCDTVYPDCRFIRATFTAMMSTVSYWSSWDFVSIRSNYMYHQTRLLTVRKCTVADRRKLMRSFCRRFKHRCTSDITTLTSGDLYRVHNILPCLFNRRVYLCFVTCSLLLLYHLPSPKIPNTSFILEHHPCTAHALSRINPAVQPHLPQRVADPPSLASLTGYTASVTYERGLS